MKTNWLLLFLLEWEKTLENGILFKKTTKIFKNTEKINFFIWKIVSESNSTNNVQVSERWQK